MERAPYLDDRWLSFTPNAAVEAFAVMEDNGSTTVDGEVVLQTKQYAAGNPNKVVYVNGPVDVASGHYGPCTLLMDKPGWVQYDTGDGTPATGESWGPKPSSWKLAKNLPGFIIIGGAASGLVLAIRQVTAWRCKAKAKGAISGSGTKIVDNVKPVSGLMPVVNSDAELSAENIYAYTIADNADLRIEWNETDDQWEICHVAPTTITVVTDLQYDSSAHQLQEKTTAISVLAQGAESAWTNWHQAVEVIPITDLQLGTGELQEKHTPSYVLEKDAESDWTQWVDTTECS